MKVGDVVIGRGGQNWRLGMCIAIDAGPDHQGSRVMYEDPCFGTMNGDLRSVFEAQYHPRVNLPSPRVQRLGPRQRAIVSAAIAAETLRRIG